MSIISNSKFLFYDNCDALPPYDGNGKGQWGGDPLSTYSMFTGGTQSLTNPDPRCYMKLSSAYSRLPGGKSYEMYVSRREDKFGTCCEWTRSEVAWLAGASQCNDPRYEFRFAAISILIDPSWQFNDIPCSIGYDSKENPDPPVKTAFGLVIEGNKYYVGGRFVSGDQNRFEIGTVVKGVWVDFLLERNWKNDNTGFMKFYMNGVLVWSRMNQPNRDGNSGALLTRIQHGLYKWAFQDSNNQGEGPVTPQSSAPIKIYLDEIKFGGPSANINDFLLTGVVIPPVEPPVEPPVPPIPPVTGTILINCGSATDNFFTGGSTYKVTSAIAGTTNDSLYQDERFGNFVYNIPVANGSYTVKLHFAEIFQKAAGLRLFNVTIQNNAALVSLDVFKKVGANTALIETFQAVVTNGILKILFATIKDNATVSAIEVIPGGTVPPPVDNTIYITDVVKGSKVITVNGASKTIVTATHIYTDGTQKEYDKK